MGGTPQLNALRVERSAAAPSAWKAQPTRRVVAVAVFRIAAVNPAVTPA